MNSSDHLFPLLLFGVVVDLVPVLLAGVLLGLVDGLLLTLDPELRVGFDLLLSRPLLFLVFGTV